jgi:hypothetical protein
MTRSVWKVIVLAASVAAVPLASCTTATPYQADVAGQRVSGGYSEQNLSEGRYTVNFSGNSLTSRDRVEGYLLYRAAELTLRDGYDWFLIVDRLTERDVQTYVRPDPLHDPWYGPGYGYWRPHWRYRYGGGSWRIWHPEWGDPFWGDTIDISSVERFEAHAEIIMRRGPIPPQEERAFDARRILADLGPTIERPERRPG